MGLLTVDPDRLRLLARALDELAERIDAVRIVAMPDEIARLVQSAREIVRVQQERVDLSLSHLEQTPRTQPCWSIADLVRQYSNWVGEIDATFPVRPSTRPDHWWTRATTDDSTRSDDILRSLDCSPDHHRAGMLIDSLEGIEVLVLGTSDLTLVEDLWTRATDPATTPPVLALERILRLLDVIYGARPWERGLATGSIDPAERARRERVLQDLAARIVAPWQLELTRPNGEHSRTISETARLLHHMSRSESAADLLLAGLPRAVMQSLSDLPLDPGERLQRIDSVAHAIGTSLEIRRMSEVDRAESSSDLDTLRNVVESLAIDGPWPISLVVGAGADWVDEYLDTSDERIRQSTLDNLQQRQVLASIAVVAVMSSVMSNMRKTHGHRADARSETTMSIPGGLASELRHTYQAIDNAAGRGQSLAQLTANNDRN